MVKGASSSGLFVMSGGGSSANTVRLSLVSVENQQLITGLIASMQSYLSARRVRSLNKLKSPFFFACSVGLNAGR